jgi:hypothetical protein
MQLTGVLAWVIHAATAAVIPPTVDGFLDDPFWSLNARVWATDQRDLPDYSARFHVGFDERAVYFAADVTDPDLTGNHDRRSPDVIRDDAVQLFLDLGDNRASAYVPDIFEYSFSVAGGAHWSRIRGPAPPASASTSPGAESAVRWAVTLKPGSTLNQHDNRDTGYVVEASIPWAELGQQWPFPSGRTIGVCFINLFNAGGSGDSPTPPASEPVNHVAPSGTPRLWQRIRPEWPSSLTLRGTVAPLPLWLGSSLYDNHWKTFASAETDPEGLWFNRIRWQERLDRMSRDNLNALLLLHPHPFPGLLALDEYPGACWFPADQLARHQDQFRWLLDEARTRGINVYLMTWNICLPAKWAESRDLDELGSDTPLAREYTRQAVTDLFNTYPELAGMATLAGENPPGCADFVVEAIARPMASLQAASTTQPATGATRRWPELIFWSWCSYPEDARRVLDACPNSRLMHYLQYEQWFKPMVDPRLARFETWALTAPLDHPVYHPGTIALGGPKSSLAYLFWGDPAWLRLLSLDLRRQGADGIFFEPYCAENWLAEEAMAYYAANLEERFDAGRWVKRLDDVYGIGPHAEQLLDAVQHASAIVPRFLALVHSQSDHYMPQFGLLLTHYLEMPTLSSYVYENTQTLDDRGYLTSRLGLTWPNPGWGERVSSIRQEADRSAPPGSTLASDVAREISLHVITCRSRLAAIRQVTPPYPEQAERLKTLLDYVDLNLALGEHFAAKIQAALAWASLQHGRGQPADCTEPLERSVRAWETVSEIAGRLYPRPVRYWQSQMVSPPPWTQNQIWQSYRSIEGHWRDQLPRFRRELELIRECLSAHPPRLQLPLWDHLNAEPEENLTSLQRIGFQIDPDKDRRFRLGPGASITADQARPSDDARSLLADTRLLDDGRHEVLTTDPALISLPPGRPYQISLAYRVVDRGGVGTTPFEIGVRPAKGGQAVGEHRFWGAPDGYIGIRILKVPPLGQPDCVIYLAIHGRAALIVDQINVQTPKGP